MKEISEATKRDKVLGKKMEEISCKLLPLQEKDEIRAQITRKYGGRNTGKCTQVCDVLEKWNVK